MVFNTTFNNIPVISWWSVLLVEETGVPGENLSEFHKVVSSTPRHERDTNSQLYKQSNTRQKHLNKCLSALFIVSASK
jgi:uncharacterized protein (DUF885 family)